MDTTNVTPAPITRSRDLVVSRSKWARLRESANLSQRDLESLSGVSRGLISLIESERRLQPTPIEARLLIRALESRGAEFVEE